MKLSEEQIAQLFLAYHDGTLNAEEKILLDAHLLAHPENAQELINFQLPIDTTFAYTGPSLERPELENLSIYATEDGHPYDKLAIGALEGLLSKEEQIIEAQLHNDEHYQNFKKRVQQTQLYPNEQLTFPNQKLLLKEVPIRAISFRKYVYPISAVAAMLIAVFLLNQNDSTRVSPELNQQKLATKKPVQQQKTLQNIATTLKPSQDIHTHQSVKHIHEAGPTFAHDCILPLPDEPIATEVYAQLPSENVSNNNITEQNTAELSGSSTEQHADNYKSSFAKEPITVKAFLLQKTNEKLFGTAAPTTDLKFETMARYASQTIGLPVRYQIEPGPQTDKVVFQLGPISIERNRVRK